MGDNTEQSTPARKRGGSTPGTSMTVDMYVAQCDRCHKRRTIDSLEEYEEIRSRLPGEVFVCEKKQGMSCGDDGDLDYDSSRTWAFDKPGLPKTPSGFKRSLIMRNDFSKMDVYYIPPIGKRVRSLKEIQIYLQANPQDYKANLEAFKAAGKREGFSFILPKVAEHTVPSDVMSEKSTEQSKDAYD